MIESVLGAFGSDLENTQTLARDWVCFRVK